MGSGRDTTSRIRQVKTAKKERRTSHQHFYEENLIVLGMSSLLILRLVTQQQIC